jgi:4'-phosphopantetheinyl transferase
LTYAGEASAPDAIVAASPPRSLNEGELHVWAFDLSIQISDATRSVLSAGETIRASKFAFDRDRNRFIQSRYCARALLGSYLGLRPAQVPIVIGEHGKPFLDMRNPIAFNLSHSHDRGVLVVACTPDAHGIGIDIERCNPQTDIHAVAETVFSTNEIAAMKRLPIEHQRSAFFRCWTRKEAYLKALGFGFTVDPRMVSVGISAEPLTISNDAGGAVMPLSVTTLSSNEAFMVSVAAPLGCTMIHQFAFADAASHSLNARSAPA